MRPGPGRAAPRPGNARARSTVAAVLLAAACSDASAIDPRDPEEPLSDDAGWAALTDWAGIPVLEGGAPRRFSSGDREPYRSFALTPPGNKDSNNFLAVCGDRPAPFLQVVDGDGPCDPGQEGHLVAAHDGPGFIERIFLAVGTLPPDLARVEDIVIGFADERLVIYVDDDPVPAYDARIVDWERGSTSPLPGGLTGATSGAVVSYAPVSYRSKVRVFLEGLRATSAYYYQVDVRRAGQTAPFDAEKTRAHGPARVSALGRAPDADCETWAAHGITVPAGATAPLFSRGEGGTIRELEITGSAAALTELSLLATWDAAPAPAIDLPLSRLFGADPVPRPYETLPMSLSVSGDEVTVTLRLPMPFAESAELALVSSGTSDHTVNASVRGVPALPRDPFGRLHASPAEAWAPQPEGGRYVVADLTGPGKYAGTVLSFLGREDPEFVLPHPFNFLEGDETITVDGLKTSTGTGTEEYLNGGFYFLEGRFDFPFSTLIATESEPRPDGARAGRARGVRWHLLTDSIHFEDSLRLDFEYGANRPVTMLEYSSVAYHYR